jgi:hypothetical protein
MRRLLEILVFTNLYKVLMKPKTQASSSHITRSKHIINPGTTSCNTYQGNFIDLAYKDRSIRGWLLNYKCCRSESIPFHYIHQGSAMNVGNIYAILILTTEMAYIC